MDINDKIISIFFASTFIVLVFVIILGAIIRKPDILIKETDEYLYYKEYELYNLDSAIYKYHKPIEYEGYVLKKYKSSHFVGVVGKGGHYTTSYYTVFKYNDKTYKESGSSTYNEYYENERVKIIEEFYPSFRVIIRKY